MTPFRNEMGMRCMALDSEIHNNMKSKFQKIKGQRVEMIENVPGYHVLILDYARLHINVLLLEKFKEMRINYDINR